MDDGWDKRVDKAYGEAKIKLTRNTRCSNDPDSVENFASIQAQRLVSIEKYVQYAIGLVCVVINM